MIDKSQMTEEEIKLNYITPAITATWAKNSIRMEFFVTLGHIVIDGKKARRYKKGVADYLLFHNDSGTWFPSELYIKYGSEAVEKIQNILSNAQPVDIHEVNSVCPEVFKDAPAKLCQPAGWIISEKGIEMIDERKQILVLVCRTPIIISRRICRMDTGLEKVEIAFKRDEKWQTAIYPRSTIFTARTITVLSDLGCTITSENAPLVD